MQTSASSSSKKKKMSRASQSLMIVFLFCFFSSLATNSRSLQRSLRRSSRARGTPSLQPEPAAHFTRATVGNTYPPFFFFFFFFYRYIQQKIVDTPNTQILHCSRTLFLSPEAVSRSLTIWCSDNVACVASSFCVCV